MVLASISAVGLVLPSLQRVSDNLRSIVEEDSIIGSKYLGPVFNFSDFQTTLKDFLHVPFSLEDIDIISVLNAPAELIGEPRYT